MTLVRISTVDLLINSYYYTLSSKVHSSAFRGAKSLELAVSLEIKAFLLPSYKIYFLKPTYAVVPLTLESFCKHKAPLTQSQTIPSVGIHIPIKSAKTVWTTGLKTNLTYFVKFDPCSADGVNFQPNWYTYKEICFP